MDCFKRFKTDSVFKWNIVFFLANEIRFNPEKVSKRAFCYRLLLNSSDDALNDSL